MKIAIVGAGAIGSYFAAKLSQTGATLALLARGERLAALRSQGLRLVEQGQEHHLTLTVSDCPAELGPQDLLILAVKAQQLPALATQLTPLLGPETSVLPAINGVPWWFFNGFGGELAGTALKSVDPQGALAELIAPERLIGSVLHLTCTAPELAVVRHGFGKGLILGEPNGALTPRLEQLAALFRAAGFDVSLSEAIQKDIWYKLWGNMTMNPISALTGATCDRILAEPHSRRLCLDIMAEAAAIGARIGCPIAQSGEDRMAVTAKLGAFKTSMLQDAEAGRPLEVEALLGAVQEIGQQLAMSTPWTDALLGLTRLKSQTLENS